MALTAAAATLSIRPAVARLTAADEAAVPPDILAAYKAASDHPIYVCPRDALRKADAIFFAAKDRIRLRYRENFDDHGNEEIVIPTHCPSPNSLPGFEKRVKAYSAAVKRLDAAIARHPSPVDEVLADENQAVRRLIDDILDSHRRRKETSICVVGSLPGIGAATRAELKRETVDAEQWSAPDAVRAQLRSIFFSRPRIDLLPRSFDASRHGFGDWHARVAAFEECRGRTTYRIRRPLISDGRAILSGVITGVAQTKAFVAAAEKGYDGWQPAYWRYGDAAPSAAADTGQTGETGSYYLIERSPPAR